MPHRMGTRRKSPRPSNEASTVAARDTMDTISAVCSGNSTALPSLFLPRAIFTATGASTSPMTTMTGPVTMGGSRRKMIPVPRKRMIRLISTYTAPAATMPPRVAGSPQVCTP